jgi:capsid protein
VRLVARKFRLRQTRGVADAIPSLQLVTDCYELMGYELQGAKQQASLSAVVIDPPEGTGNTVPTGYAEEPEADGAEGEGVGDGENAEDGPDPEEQEVEAEIEAARASALEDLSGGNVDYLENGADVKFLPNNRPASQLPAFLDFANDMAGAAFGLNHSYSRNKADGSFTAFRGDLAMTWASLDDLRQFLEDKFFDWVAKRAINWAIENGELDAPTDEDWADAIAWTYPRMISVDPEKEAKAIEAKIRAGLTTYRQELGPDWLNQLQEISEERKLMHSLGLRHPQDETTAGAPVDPEPAQEETESND